MVFRMNIRKNNYDYLSSKYDAEKIANDISVNIVTAYCNVIIRIWLKWVRKRDVSSTASRIFQMVQVGSLPNGDLLNAEPKAQEELQLINVKNQKHR